MKVTTQYPVAGLAGKDGPIPEKVYYIRRGDTIARQYSRVDINDNQPMQDGKIINDNLIKAWALLSDDEAASWHETAQNWNVHIKQPARQLSAWLAYYTVNFYRQVLGLAILGEGIEVYPPRTVNSVDYLYVDGDTPRMYANIDVANVHAPGARVILWTTTPTPRYRRAYRKPDLRMIEGMGPQSSYELDDLNGLNQVEVDYIPHGAAPGRYLWTQARIIEANGYPQPRRRVPSRILEALPMISTGEMIDVITPSTMYVPGSPSGTHWAIEPGGAEIHGQAGLDSIDDMISIAVPYKAGSVISAVGLAWGGAADEDNAINVVQSFSQILTDGEMDWTTPPTYGFDVNFGRDTGGGVQNNRIVVAPSTATVPDNKQMRIEIRPTQATPPITIYAVILWTSKRVY